MIPLNAETVAEIAGGIEVVDVGPFLPVHHAKVYPIKKKTSAVFVHHSGGDNGRVGLDWAKCMANWHVNGKKWPGIAYHYGVSWTPTVRDRKLIVMQFHPSHVLCYHTKGCSKFSLGIVLQGHLGKEEPSGFQVECLEALLPWLAKRHDLNLKKDLGWHSNAWKWGGIPKPACPGKHTVRMLKDYVENC
jgi:hypothetical protein